MSDVKHSLNTVIMSGIPLLLAYPYLSRSLNSHITFLVTGVIDTPQLGEDDESNGDGDDT